MNDEPPTPPSRVLHCKKLGHEAEGLSEPPMFGALGQEVFENVSKEAWEEWSQMQLKIVNEYHLDLSEKAHRKTLEKQLRAFLQLEGGDEGDPAMLAVGTPTE
ncbi:MAG: oxidative damage protection protein [Deltaproteobacteria bacterium]|nr:oxidative damage protection protein [Deltaproteobacteria bacterium]